MKKLTFIVPCYNEEKNIKYFYEDVLKHFKKVKYKIELIFINDGSKDNTILELKKLTETKDFEIKVINFSRNFGKEAAVFAGLKRSTGDLTVLIDADMQQPPHLVLDMLEVIENNEDVDIVAYYQEKRIENKVLMFLKTNFYKIISKLTGLKFNNDTSDFRLFRRNVLETILSLTEHNRFTKGIFSWIGFNTYYLPYVPNERLSGKTSWNLKNLFKYAFSGILSFSKSPFSLILKLGIFSMFVSIVWLIILLFTIGLSFSLQYLAVFILFMFGINFTVLSLIIEFTHRNYIESLNRPIYIEKEIITNE